MSPVLLRKQCFLPFQRERDCVTCWWSISPRIKGALRCRNQGPCRAHDWLKVLQVRLAFDPFLGAVIMGQQRLAPLSTPHVMLSIALF